MEEAVLCGKQCGFCVFGEARNIFKVMKIHTMRINIRRSKLL